MFRFIDQKRAAFPVAAMCQVLDVSRSGFYAWRRRRPSARQRQDWWLTSDSKRIHAASRQTYGSRGCMPSCATRAAVSATSGWPG